MASLAELCQLASYEILRGYSVRPLEKAPSLSREDFKAHCKAFIEEAESEGSTEEEKAEARKIAMRMLSDRSLFFFVTAVLGLSSFCDNDYVYRLCHDVQRHKWNRLWIIAREHFKTTIITEASTIWELTRDSDRTYLIASYNKTFAQTCVEHIKGMIEASADILSSLWPEVFWKNPARCWEYDSAGCKRVWTWTKGAIELKRSTHPKEMTVTAGTIEGGGQTGGHYSHLIYDDAETPETVQTAESIDKAYHQILMGANTGKTESLNVAYIGTFYARNDIYVRMIQDGIVQESIVQPCCDEHGVPIHYTEKALLEKFQRMSIDEVATQMLCDPSLNSQASFDVKWLRYWSPSLPWERGGTQIVPIGENIYTFVDPASGKHSDKGDYTAIFTIGFDSLGNMKVYDIVRDRLDSDGKFRELVHQASLYRPLSVFYEEESMQADIALLRAQMEQSSFFFQIVPYSMKSKGSKVKRIEKLRTPFSQGKVLLPQRAIHINRNGEEEDMVRSFIADEYLSFPTSSHDDAMDVLSSAYLLMLDRIVQTPSVYGEDRRGYVWDAVSGHYREYEEATYTDPFDNIASLSDPFDPMGMQ